MHAENPEAGREPHAVDGKKTCLEIAHADSVTDWSRSFQGTVGRDLEIGDDLWLHTEH